MRITKITTAFANVKYCRNDWYVRMKGALLVFKKWWCICFILLLLNQNIWLWMHDKAKWMQHVWMIFIKMIIFKILMQGMEMHNLWNMGEKQKNLSTFCKEITYCQTLSLLLANIWQRIKWESIVNIEGDMSIFLSLFFLSFFFFNECLYLIWDICIRVISQPYNFWWEVF